MKPTGLSAWREQMLDRPSVLTANRCAICGRYATNAHHIVQKGMGGVSKDVERRIPKMTLCGSGTTGCHGAVHGRILHIVWSDGLGGWVFRWSSVPCDDLMDWIGNSSLYLPVPGWVEQKRWGDVIGGRR